jgi:hypothetical protein
VTEVCESPSRQLRPREWFCGDAELAGSRAREVFELCAPTASIVAPSRQSRVGLSTKKVIWSGYYTRDATRSVIVTA